MPHKSLKKELDVIILTYFVNSWCMFKNYFLENCNTNKVISTFVFKKKWSLVSSNIFEHDFFALTFIVVNHFAKFYYQGNIIYADISQNMCQFLCLNIGWKG